ncbi:hypothetical protein [Lentilactobacillus sp. SPB1-3]|uniref:Uncharacterized protein n=1 Tax=Lentilactobacillus terminaliae TaxID=3003483 RepID=A0ACD5DDM1_9LACO|nr:hypothetical protein [Lentilactobacillus sp. SPB1-3]MCZ0977696.1 hypothetical protein [Lentilactobacillus sp. SPB1-3]
MPKETREPELKKIIWMLVPAYVVVIVAIFFAPFNHGLALLLYAIATLFGIALLVTFNKQPVNKYLIYPLIVYSIVEITNIFFEGKFLNNYYDKLFTLLFMIVVSYMTHQRKNRKVK